MNRIAIIVTGGPVPPRINRSQAGPTTLPLPQPPDLCLSRALGVRENIAPRNVTLFGTCSLEHAWQLDLPGVEEQSSFPPVTPLGFPISLLNSGIRWKQKFTAVAGIQNQPMHSVHQPQCVGAWERDRPAPGRPCRVAFIIPLVS